MDSLPIVSIRAAFGMASFLVGLTQSLFPVALLALPFSWLWNVALAPAIPCLQPIGYKNDNLLGPATYALNL